ncbi:prepilin-type N-terminal cleavage/methylation domain-containing protein [Candidatus Dojkabacteria bacterium]|nr:prepilin-type N-terminal cleavage/methylation domain-containing protein [Candidatus Dojkabacteria bacterium]
MKKINKAFSLVELLVAMAIIAVLISIAAYGIQIVQRNARNTKRRKVVEDLQLLAADVQTNTFMYPSGLRKSGNNLEFTDSGGSVVGTYPVQGFTNVGSVLSSCSNLGGGTGGGGGEENTVTVCFEPTNLRLGVVLEGTNNGYVTSL